MSDWSLVSVQPPQTLALLQGRSWPKHQHLEAELSPDSDCKTPDYCSVRAWTSPSHPELEFQTHTAQTWSAGDAGMAQKEKAVSGYFSILSFTEERDP